MALLKGDWDFAQQRLVADIAVFGGSYAHAVRALKGEFGVTRTRNAVTGIINRAGGREQFITRFRSKEPDPALKRYIPATVKAARPKFFGKPQTPRPARPRSALAQGQQFPEKRRPPPDVILAGSGGPTVPFREHEESQCSFVSEETKNGEACYCAHSRYSKRYPYCIPHLRILYGGKLPPGVLEAEEPPPPADRKARRSRGKTAPRLPSV